MFVLVLEGKGKDVKRQKFFFQFLRAEVRRKNIIIFQRGFSCFVFFFFESFQRNWNKILCLYNKWIILVENKKGIIKKKFSYIGRKKTVKLGEVDFDFNFRVGKLRQGCIYVYKIGLG